ncbi:unnamed protein product [Closterium sp. Yama58-4]|nr:unnamed protein product [Closterium sp. Yama58-4]
MAQKGQEVTAARGKEELPASHEDALKRGEEALTSTEGSASGGGFFAPLKDLASRFMGHAAPETEEAFQTGLDIPINTQDVPAAETSQKIVTQDEPAAGDVSTNSQAARGVHVDTAEGGSTIGSGREEAVGEFPQQERERSAEMAKESAKEEARKATEEAKEHAASGWDAAKRGVAETSESIKQSAEEASEKFKQPAAREPSEDVSRKDDETAAASERVAREEPRKAAEGAAVAEREAEDARAGVAAGIEESKGKAAQAREEAEKQAEEGAQGVKEIAREAQAEAQAEGEKAQGSFESMAERARGVMERTLEGIQETLEAARERSARAGETAEQAGETAREAGREAYERGKGFATETKDAAVENLEAAGTVTARGLGKAAGTVEGAAEAVGESAKEAVSAAAERTAEGIESAQEGARGAYDRTVENVSASAAGAHDRTAEGLESAQEGIASAEEGAKDAYERTAENISASAAGARDTGAAATGTVVGAVGQIVHSFAEMLGVAGKHEVAEAPPADAPPAEAPALQRPLAADVNGSGERSAAHEPYRAPASLSAHRYAEKDQQEGGGGASGGGDAGEAERRAGRASAGKEKGAMEPGLGGGVRYHPEPSADLGGSGLSATFAAGSKADVPQNYPHTSQEKREESSARGADVAATAGGGAVESGKSGTTSGLHGITSGSHGAGATAEESGSGHGGGDGTAATETAAGRSAVKSPSSDERGVFGGGGVPGARSVPWDQVSVGGGVDEKGVDRRQQVEMLKGGAREPLCRITKAVMDKTGIETVEPKHRIAKENIMTPKIAGRREELGIVATAAEHVKDAMVGRRSVRGKGDVESAKMADPELGRLVKEAKQKEQ